MDRKELITKALQLIERHDITAYEIEKNTSLTAVGVQKIINGETKKPNENTLRTIISYITSKYNNNYDGFTSELDGIDIDKIAVYLINNEEKFRSSKVYNLWKEKFITEEAIKEVERRINGK